MVVTAAPTAVRAGLIGPAPAVDPAVDPAPCGPSAAGGRVREVPVPGRESRVRGRVVRGRGTPVSRVVLRAHGAPRRPGFAAASGG
ncbi:hypothetical protein [Streptomyces sp. NPDC059564]|uniref:hypothetical protein n=1 Tax=Streptomyces sp. NPDC059564 TaxID=3346865 RepID=UPI00369CEE0C